MKLFTIRNENSGQNATDNELNKIGCMLSGMKQTHTEASAEEIWGLQ